MLSMMVPSHSLDEEEEHARPASDAISRGQARPRPEAGVWADRGNRPVVLLVDDDLDDHRILAFAFKKAGLDWGLRMVTDAAGCFEELESRTPPTMVLLDLNMPGIDGWELLRRLRGDPRYRSLPLIIYTTAFDQSFVDRAYQQGANAYLVKPDTVGELVEQLESLNRFWFTAARLPERP